jgi:predicted GH43/DUF377 family glycosyl hydrolase
MVVAMLACPTSAIDLTIETWVPEYLLTDQLNLTGIVEGTYQPVKYRSGEDWETGSNDNLTVDESGRLWLYPDFKKVMQNDGKSILTGGTGWDRDLGSKNIVKRSGKYYLYYSGRPNSTGAPQIGLATSTDGVNFTKYTGNPIIKKGPGGFDIKGAENPVVLYDGGTWRMWYAGKPSSNSSLVCYATSTDGIKWTKYSGNPVTNKPLHNSTWNGFRSRPVGILKENATLYRLYVEGQGNNSSWKMGMWTSSNLTHWQPYGNLPIRVPMDNNWEESTANFQCAEKSSDSYRMWIYGGKDERSLGYMWGTNGISWPRSVGPIMSPANGTIYSKNLLDPTAIDEGDHYYIVMGCDDGNNITYGSWRMYPQKMNGTFISKVHTMVTIARIAELDWDEGLPAGGYFDIYFRWGNTTKTLTDWRLVEYDQRMLNVTARHFQFMAKYRSPEDWFRIGLLHFDVKVQAMIADVKVKVGGGPWQEAEVDYHTWFANLTLPDGDHVVTVNATDSFGHSIQRTLPVRVDLYPPEGLIVLEGGNLTTRSRFINYSLEANDTHGVPLCMVSLLPDFSDATWQPFHSNGTWEYGGLDGGVTIFARFKDGAGRVSDRVLASIWVDTAPPRAWMVINGGAKYTNSTSLTVTVNWKDLSGIISVNASEFYDLTGGREIGSPGGSETFTFSIIIRPGDGIRTVYVLLSDGAGWQVMISDTIILDTTPPAASFVINGDDPFCIDGEVYLNVSIHDANPVSVRWANDDGDWLTEWETYGGSYAFPWNLSEGPDGPRSARLLVKDIAGNEVEEFDDIVLDTTPPEGTLTINDGATITMLGLVICQLNVTDATSGIYLMRVSNQRQLLTESPWQDYREAFEWLLKHGDGARTVFVDVMDRAGLVTTFQTSIILDASPPDGQMEIDGGREFTTVIEVIITFNVRDVNPGVDLMRVSESADFDDGEWIYFQRQLPWTLSSEDGMKTVFAEITDAMGRSVLLSDRIVLDTEVPSGVVTINDGDEFTPTREVKVGLWTDDVTSGIAGMMVSEDPAFTGLDWRSVSSFFGWNLSGGDGRKTLYIALKDVVGWEVVLEDSIVLDTTPPDGHTWVIGHLLYVNDTEVGVMLNVDDRMSGLAGMYVIGDPAFDPTVMVPMADIFTWTLSGEDGPKVLKLRIVDNVSNEAEFEVQIIFDTAPPTITFDHETVLKTSKVRVEIVPVVIDEIYPNPIVSYRIDGGAWKPVDEGSFHLRLSDPDHIVEVQAIDGAGNVAIEVVEIEYTAQYDPDTNLSLLVILVVLAVAILVIIYVKGRSDTPD